MKQGNKVTDAALLDDLKNRAIDVAELADGEADPYGYVVDMKTLKIEAFEDPHIPGVYAVQLEYQGIEEGDDPATGSWEQCTQEFLVTPGKGQVEDVEFNGWPPVTSGEYLTTFELVN